MAAGAPDRYHLMYGDGGEWPLPVRRGPRGPGVAAALIRRPWTGGGAGGGGAASPAPTLNRKWEAQLARLAAYKAEHGDCSVPKCWAEDPRLGRWVDTQRTGKRLLDRGEPSEGMTVARAARLMALGFAWAGSKDLCGAGAWEAQLVRLVAYNAAHGDCNVPKGWAEDPKLANWVDKQRALKKKLDRGEASDGMTAERSLQLDALGFEWSPRNAAADGKCAAPAAERAPTAQPPAGPGKQRQRHAPGMAAPFMQLLY